MLYLREAGVDSLAAGLRAPVCWQATVNDFRGVESNGIAASGWRRNDER